jgi:hypothetical protein
MRCGKTFTAGQATADNMAHAHCRLETLGYKHTFTICNTYRFPTVTKVARTRLNVMLYVVHCLSLSKVFFSLPEVVFLSFRLTIKAQWSLYIPPGLTFTNSVLPIQCVYVLYMDLRTNSEFFLIQH